MLNKYCKRSAKNTFGFFYDFVVSLLTIDLKNTSTTMQKKNIADL